MKVSRSEVSSFDCICLWSNHLCIVREARRQIKANAVNLPTDGEESMDDAFINESAEDRQARLARQDKLAGRLGRLERRQLEEEETRVNLITLKADEQAALAGDPVARRRYMTIADKMITGMRQAPVMFPVDRVSNAISSCTASILTFGRC